MQQAQEPIVMRQTTLHLLPIPLRSFPVWGIGKNLGQLNSFEPGHYEIPLKITLVYKVIVYACYSQAEEPMQGTDITRGLCFATHTRPTAEDRLGPAGRGRLPLYMRCPIKQRTSDHLSKSR